MTLPNHISLTLEHNPHRQKGLSAEEWVESIEMWGSVWGLVWPSASHKTRAIDTKEIWTLSYKKEPEERPTYLAAPTLPELLSFAQEVEKVSV